MTRYVIGLDNGGTSVKATLFDEYGTQIYVSQRKLDVIRNTQGYMERDLTLLMDKNIQCLKEIVDHVAIGVRDIKGMSFSGHGKGLYLLDAYGKALGNGILSTDVRAREIVEKWEEQGINQQIFKKTYQKVQEVQPVALLRWLKLHKYDDYKKIGTVFAVKDFVRYCLSGEKHGEYTDFSGSNLIDFETKTYCKEILRMFDIEEVIDALPPLVQSTDICAYLSKEAADKTGLWEGLPLAAGMFDVDACSIGCGMIDERFCTMIAGTWSINVFITKQCRRNDQILFQSFYTLPEYVLVEESSATSCGNLEWFLKEMFLDLDYEECNRLVSSKQPREDDMVYLPFLYGSNVANMHGCLYNMQSFHKRANIIRAVYEGVAFAHKMHLIKLLLHRDTPKVIRIAGGVIHSPVWLQIFADSIQLPLEVVENEEIGTQGAAICAGVAVGIYENYKDAVEKHVKIKNTIFPNVQYAKIYKAKYNQYCELLNALRKR